MEIIMFISVKTLKLDLSVFVYVNFDDYDFDI